MPSRSLLNKPDMSFDLMPNEYWAKYNTTTLQPPETLVPKKADYVLDEAVMGAIDIEGDIRPFTGNRAPAEPIGPKPDVPVIDEENTVLGQMKKSNELARKSMNMQLGLAGANFLISIMNADNAYNAVKGQARLNILQARNQAADALFRGRQAQLDRQSEGYLAGESALLEMAAQGQDVSGQAVGKVQSSLETVGIMNGMQEQINSMREALGFELEEIAYEYQIDQAGAKAQSDKFNAGLQLAASFLGAGL